MNVGNLGNVAKKIRLPNRYMIGARLGAKSSTCGREICFKTFTKPFLSLPASGEAEWLSVKIFPRIGRAVAKGTNVEGSEFLHYFFETSVK